jgi:hypothetical protein
MASTGIFLFAKMSRLGQVRCQRTAPITLYFKLIGKLIIVNEISIGVKIWTDVSLPWSDESE